jgi:hypothetical protein
VIILRRSLLRPTWTSFPPMATTTESVRPPRVFVSYAHERGVDGHREVR